MVATLVFLDAMSAEGTFLDVMLLQHLFIKRFSFFLLMFRADMAEVNCFIASYAVVSFALPAIEHNLVLH